MRIALMCGLGAAIMMSAAPPPAFADDYELSDNHEEPPFLRTGKDLLDACVAKRAGGAYICQGMYEAIADTTEAGRLARGQCPPAIVQMDDVTQPLEVIRLLEAARDHPDWLKLPVATFVDKSERLARCDKK